MTLVVGIDGSVSCLDAVRVAVRRGAPGQSSVRLVHAFAWPPPASRRLFPGSLGTAEGELRRAARTMLASAEAMARQTDPAVPVQRRLVTGDPVSVLIEQAATAEMVVLGDRGLGGFAGLALGSIAAQVAAHSPVPVLVVKGNTAVEGPVVVGIEGSDDPGPLMTWASREAEARQVALHAGKTVTTLIRLSETAQLMVVGARSSTGQHLLHHALCPVLVIPR